MLSCSLSAQFGTSPTIRCFVQSGENIRINVIARVTAILALIWHLSLPVFVVRFLSFCIYEKQKSICNEKILFVCLFRSSEKQKEVGSIKITSHKQWWSVSVHGKSILETWKLTNSSSSK